MENRVKSIKSATLPLPWLEFGGEEIKREIIEALAHDLGKASQGRFEDHAAASTELLRRAGFGDEAVLNLIERHHKSLGEDDFNLRLLQIADRLASSGRADGGKRYSLNIRLAPKHSFKEASYKLPSDEKLRDIVIKMHSEGFEIDGIAYQTGLPQLHIKLLEKVLSKTLRRRCS